MAGLRRISYLWKEPDAAGNYSTAVSLHSHTNQSKGNARFPGEPGKSVPAAAPFAGPKRAEIQGMSPDSRQLRRSLLDAAADAAHCFRRRKRPDRKETRPDAAGFHHRPRHDRRAHAAAHRRCRSSHSGFRRVERAVWRRSGLPLRHPQSAQRFRRRLDEDLRRVHRESERKAAYRDSGRSARSAQRADRLQPSHVGSLSDRRRQGGATGRGVPRRQSRIHARLRAQRASSLGRKPQRQAARQTVEQAADLRRRPPWPGTERER